MPTARDLWVLLAGVVATAVNAAAGGGTLLSFPALLAGGLSPLAANATSTVALLPGQLTSLWAYRREIAAARADAALIAGPGLVGGAFGAWLLIRLGSAVFERVVPALLVVAAALLLAQPLVARWVIRRTDAGNAPAAARPVRARSLLPALAASVVVAIYFGYFGAGGGILFLGAMGLVLSWRPLAEVNALKVEIASLSNLVAAAVFVGSELRHPTGAVAWRAALPLAIGGVIGGWLGVGVVRKLPPAALRAIAAVVGVGIAIYLAVR